jgi:hypothetical protein
MLRVFGPGASLIRCLGLAAVATLVLSAATARRTDALTLINPASSPAAKAATDGMITAVRHGGGGFHGGGAHVSGFRGGGHVGHIGGFRAAPVGHIGGYRHGGYRYGAVHRYGGYAGYPRFYRHHHIHRRVYYGGYYPAYYPRYYHPRRCRIVWTYYGPRRVCRWHHWHRPYRAYW